MPISNIDMICNFKPPWTITARKSYLWEHKHRKVEVNSVELLCRICNTVESNMRDGDISRIKK